MAGLTDRVALEGESPTPFDTTNRVTLEGESPIPFDKKNPLTLEGDSPTSLDIVDIEVSFTAISNHRTQSDTVEAGGRSWRVILFPNREGWGSLFVEWVDGPETSSFAYVARFRLTLEFTTKTEAEGHLFKKRGDDWGFSKFMPATQIRRALERGAKVQVHLEVASAPEPVAGYHHEKCVSLCPDWRILKADQVTSGRLVPRDLPGKVAANTALFPLIWQTRPGCCGDACIINLCVSLGATKFGPATPQHQGGQTLRGLRDRLNATIQDFHRAATVGMVSASEGQPKLRAWAEKANAPKVRIIVNYRRPSSSWGHFSIILGWLDSEEAVLVFDPNENYGLQVVPWSLLWDAVNTPDRQSGSLRGLVVVEVK